MDHSSPAARVLYNHICIARILQFCDQAVDVFNLSLCSRTILTLIAELEPTTCERLSFQRRRKYKNKHIKDGYLKVLDYRNLQHLDLSGTAITVKAVRLVFQRTQARTLCLRECRSVEVLDLVMFLRQLLSLRRRGRLATTIHRLEVANVAGLFVDAAYAGKQEWYYDRHFPYVKNVSLLHQTTDLLGISTDIVYCQGRCSVTSVQYHQINRERETYKRMALYDGPRGCCQLCRQELWLCEECNQRYYLVCGKCQQLQANDTQPDDTEPEDNQTIV